MAQVVILAGERLELAQLVGVARLAGLDFDVEVAPEVGQMPLKPRDIKAGGDALHDLPHSEKACFIAEDRVHRVVCGGRLLDQGVRRALVAKGAPDLVAERRKEMDTWTTSHVGETSATWSAPSKQTLSLQDPSLG